MTRTVARYFNRELSWLEFDQRVLDEALDPTVPLLERLKFLAISASNLDEFFRVRVGGLRRQCADGVTRPDPAGMTPAEQLAAIHDRAKRLQQDQYACLREELLPQLAEHGLQRVTPEALSEQQLAFVERLFDEELFAVLCPLAVSDSEAFPLLPNESMNLCVRLRAAKQDDAGAFRFAVIPLASVLPRFITLPADGGLRFLLLEDAVAMFIDRFFEGFRVLEATPFRITRNADMTLREERAADLTSEMEELLDERHYGECVRLEILNRADRITVDFLSRALRIGEDAVFVLPGPLDLGGCFALATRAGFDHLKYSAWPPQHSPRIPPETSMFETIAAGDILLYHPYESFEPVQRLIDEAADDPDVLAIKQTLYRTSRDSPIVAALQRAAERGKHVTAVVELKARFDEARNIRWARTLEQAGAHVIYGVKGLKTHAKLCIIIRREPAGIRRYVHFGTGNYNEVTARMYSDAGLLTCNEEFGADAVAFFNAITGYSHPQRYHRLQAAPLGLRESLLELIQAETLRHREGQQGRIFVKLNSLVDPTLIEALYEASEAGVDVRLNIRGICCLRPDVLAAPDEPEPVDSGFPVDDHAASGRAKTTDPRRGRGRIEVVSIIDRFLEHSRILAFHHGGDWQVFLSSADWMPRNLDRRIELLVPVDHPDCRKRLLEILQVYFRDNVKARRLQNDGTFSRPEPPDDPSARPLRAQDVLYRRACEAVAEAEKSRLTEFIPHKAPEE